MHIVVKCSGVLLSPESVTAKETEAYDRYVKSKKRKEKKKERVVSGTKAPCHRACQFSLVNVMGEKHKNIVSDLNISCSIFLNIPLSLLVSSWPHEINVDPAVLDQSMYVCDTQC